MRKGARVEFISITKTLRAIADRVDPPQLTGDAEIDAMTRAAGVLHRELLNADQPPRWVGRHNVTHEPVYNDAELRGEGLHALEVVVAWPDRRRKANARHYEECIRVGLDPEAEKPHYSLNDGMYGDLIHLAFGDGRIGFDVRELTQFLDDRHVPHALSSAANSATDLTAATPTAKVETTVERQDRRLKMCEDAGLKMPVLEHRRLPNGIGKMADAEGISRQAFSDDVWAAIKRKMVRLSGKFS